MNTDMLEIRQLPRLTPAHIQSLPRLEGEEDPLRTDGLLALAGLLDIIIDVRRAEILLLLDNRSTDNFYIGNACLLVGRGFSNLNYPYPHHRNGPLGERVDFHHTAKTREGILFKATMEILDHWEFSFLATELVFFVTEIPGLIDPLPSYGCPGDDVSESFIEDNNPKWTSKVKILGVSAMQAKNHHDSESEISHPLEMEPIGKKRSKLYEIFKPKE